MGEVLYCKRWAHMIKCNEVMQVYKNEEVDGLSVGGYIKTFTIFVSK